MKACSVSDAVPCALEKAWLAGAERADPGPVPHLPGPFICSRGSGGVVWGRMNETETGLAGGVHISV